MQQYYSKNLLNNKYSKEISERRINLLRDLCVKINYEWNNIALLHQALTHTSYANESKIPSLHNERLEFLGDSVLDLVVSEYLYDNYPDMLEGQLTKTRARLVCEPTLAQYAQKIDIGRYLLLGKGERYSGGRNRNSILADSFEAIVGAIYLDGGFVAVSQFVLQQMNEDLVLVEQGEYTAKDYKTMLQEHVQKRNPDGKIVYSVVNEYGPDHDKEFEVAINVNSEELGRGQGKTKKQAEQLSAYKALVLLNVLSSENQRS